MEEFSRLDWLVVESKGPFPFKSTQLNVKGECRPAGCEITLLQRIDQVPGVLYRGIPELLLSGCASVFLQLICQPCSQKIGTRLP